MTCEEATKVLLWGLKMLEGYPYITDEYGTIDPAVKVGAFSMAIEALKKLTPIKPIEINDGGFWRADMYIVTEDDIARVAYNHKVYGAHTQNGRKKKYGIHTCKLCGCDFDEARDNMYAPVNFCPCCGQAIDWSDI